MTTTQDTQNPLAAAMTGRGLRPAEVERLTDRLEDFPRVGRETVRRYMGIDESEWNPDLAASIAVALGIPLPALAPTAAEKLREQHAQATRRLKAVGAVPGLTKPGSSPRPNRRGPGRKTSTLRGPSPTAPAAQKAA